jgi:hypothetical protein
MRLGIFDADLCFVKKKVDRIRASFRKELRRVRDSSIITAAATCFDELILDTEMYEQSLESAHACVVKYIRARSRVKLVGLFKGRLAHKADNLTAIFEPIV